MNAQGDPNIQRAIIQQLVREGCDLLMPIGTAASQMTVNLAKEQKIICLAADIQTISPPKGSSLTSLNDELSAKDSLSFLHDAFPKVKKITLLYSASEKVAKEVPLVLEAAKTQGIAVQKLMVQTQPELYTIGQAIAPDSEAIFILKDHLIVSGIQSVVKQAEKRFIPVMTSDEGSVISGAAFAIGVKEADIGREGAELAKEVLNGTPPEKIPSRSLRGPFPLFVNQKACVMQGVDLNSFIKKSEELGLRIEYTNKGG
jgi:putative ABC transport system substrate-binding protein